MSSGPSLYRRHRPRTFADVVGQEAVVRTLRNAVERGKVHHAYLFVGSRGTGKTSMAKILAACLNCEQGPTVEPCGACDACQAIASATSLDVIEMDAASNNSVDDIRELRESVAYAPVSGRHKVYILDEAHMLSPQAWNAFLKTLEEPPPNTIFVLATTEAQKILPTVVDRCHRFDFARPTVEQIAGVVRRAAEAESIRVPSQAVALIARSATGSFRDALGTLEQLVTYSGPEIALDDVVAVLGVAETELLDEALDAIAAHDPRRALLAAARSAERGRDAAGLIRDLEVHARELMVVQTLGEVPSEISVTPDADERLAAQAARVERYDVVRLLDLLALALEAVKAGADPRTQLELALVKAATPAVDASTRALLARLERLEAALGRTSTAGDGGPAPGANPGAPSDPDPAGAPPGSRTPREGTAVAVPSAAAASGDRPVAPAPAPAPGAAAAAAPPPSPVVTLADPRPQGAPVAAEAATALAVATDAAIAPAAAPFEPGVAPAPNLASNGAPNLASNGADGIAPAAAAAALDLATVCDLWPAVIDAVRADKPLLAAVITEATPVALARGELLVAFPAGSAFLQRKADDQANRLVVGAALRTVTGHTLRPAYELREPGDEAPASASPSDEDWVGRFKNAFDAEELPAEAPPAETAETPPAAEASSSALAQATPRPSGDH